MTKAFDSSSKFILAREENDAQVVGIGPVKRGALYQQNFLLNQKIQHHLLIVMERVTFEIDFRKQIYGSLGFYAGEAGNLLNRCQCGIALITQATARHNKFI